MNNVMICGRLAADPELRYTEAGTAVANFRVATEEVWNDGKGEKQKRVEFHRFVAWGPLAENVSKYTYKGRQVLLTGMLKTRSWTDRDDNKRYTTEIHANGMELLGNFDKNKKETAQTTESNTPEVTDEYNAPTGDVAEDEAAARAQAFLDESV